MKNVSEICLQIDGVLKMQNIPFETYKQLNSLLCDIIRTHNEKVGYVDDVKIESDKDFNKLLKALLEAYPKSAAEYVDFDIYCRELMDKFINSTTN